MANPWFTSVLSTELLHRQMRKDSNTRAQWTVGRSSANLRCQSALTCSPMRI